MKKRPNFKGQGQVTTRKPVEEEKTDNVSQSKWYQKFFEEGTLAHKFFKVFLSFLIAWFVLWLSNKLWFDHHSFSVNDHYDFWAKTACVFIAGGLILLVVDAVFQTDGNSTKLAVLLLFFVTVAGHYFPAPYYKDGKPTVYVNSRTGDVYQNAYADIKHDARTNRDYFLHPRSNDTCWNDAPANVELLSFDDSDNEVIGSNSGYNPPSEELVYYVGIFNFNLRAGETLNHWIAFREPVHIELLSDNYDYKIIYSESEQYHDGPGVVIPDRSGTRFFLKAGSTNQSIVMKVTPL